MGRLKGYTVGCELELADIDTRLKLPKCATWDYKDFSICNSSGAANDPKKELNRYGGEIHMEPTESVFELFENIEEVYDTFPKFSFNYTTNFHVHVRVPRLKDNLGELKQISRWLRKYEHQMYELVDPIPVPLRKHFTLKKERDCFKGAWKRYKRRIRSHQYVVSDNVFRKMMNAKTSGEFNLAHYPIGADGKPQLHLMQRAGVNLAHLWKPTGTIEFRFFTMTENPEKLMSALRWPLLILQAALETGHSPERIVDEHKLCFQKFFPYDYKLDVIFQQTKLEGKSRAEVKRVYDKLLKKGILKRSDIA